MPSLLSNLCKSCLKEHCSSGRQAMAIHFPDSGPQNGIFCSLNSFLPSSTNTHPKSWKILVADRSPECLHDNCAKYTIPDFPAGEITVIDQFSHFEVHIDAHPKYASKLWPVVRRAIFAGVENASKTIGYTSRNPVPAILCPAHPDEEHLATVDEEEMV